jgi:hypothetical protein
MLRVSQIMLPYTKTETTKAHRCNGFRTRPVPDDYNRELRCGGGCGEAEGLR